MTDTTREALLAWLDLLRISNSIKKTVNEKLRVEFGQSISRFDVLSSLQRVKRNGLRAGELSRQMVVSEGNVTQLMSKLLRDGLVLKRQHENDARVVIYSLSDEGAELFDRMAQAHRGWMTDIFSKFSEAELTTLRQLLHQLPNSTNSENTL